MPFKTGIWPIPKARVKLPKPATSDYIVPSSASASSEVGSGNFLETATNWTIVDSGHATITFPSADNNYVLQFKFGSSSHYVPIDATVSADIDIPASNILVRVDYYKNVQTNSAFQLHIEVDGNVILNELGSNNTTNTYYVRIPVGAGTHTMKVRVYDPTSKYSTYGTVEVRLMKYDYVTGNLVDDNTNTLWMPANSNSGENCYIDAGAPKIISGLRVYWGSNVPNAFTVEVSTDATNWTPVYKQKSPPTPNSWQEISFYATYARYIRIYLSDQGAAPVEIGEIQYYSSIVERVASEHGHGSGPEPWARGANVRLKHISDFAKLSTGITSLQKELQNATSVTPDQLIRMLDLLKQTKDLIKKMHM